MAAENCKCQIKNTEFDLPKTEVLTLPGQGQFAAEPERRICRRGQAAGDFFPGRAAGLPAFGDFCPDRVAKRQESAALFCLPSAHLAKSSCRFFAGPEAWM